MNTRVSDYPSIQKLFVTQQNLSDGAVFTSWRKREAPDSISCFFVCVWNIKLKK